MNVQLKRDDRATLRKELKKVVKGGGCPLRYCLNNGVKLALNKDHFGPNKA